MNRRRFLRTVSVSLLAAPLEAVPADVAAQTLTVPHVGLIATTPALVRAFKEGLREVGYIDGQNIRIVQRSVSGGSEGRARAVVDEFMRLGVAVIVATAVHNVKAAQQAVRVPIVAIDMESDPVASGLVKSLARPGGNLTGLYMDLLELAGKHIQLLQEALGHVSRIGVVWDDRIGRPQFDALTVAARSANLSVASLPIRGPEDVEPLFASAAKSGVRAIVMLTAPVIALNRERLAEVALRHWLPSISVYTYVAEAGGLIGYGPDFLLLFRQVASYVDRILKGAQAADLPIERPARFNLVVNLGTAKALGVTMPPSLLLRADQVIE